MVGLGFLGGRLGLYNNMVKMNSIDFYHKTGFTWGKLAIDLLRGTTPLRQMAAKAAFVGGQSFLIRLLLDL